MASLQGTGTGPPGQANSFTDLLAGIDPDAFDLPDDLLLSPPDPSSAPPPPSLIGLLAGAGVNTDDDERLPSSQPNERASNWLMAPPALAPPPPHLAPAGQTTPPAGASSVAPAFTSIATLSATSRLGKGPAPARPIAGGPDGQAGDDAAATDAACAKRRKVSRNSWTAGSSPEHSGAGHSDAADSGQTAEDEWDFVQPDRESDPSPPRPAPTTAS